MFPERGTGRSLTRPPIRRRWWSADFRSGAFSGVFKTGRVGDRRSGGSVRMRPAERGVGANDAAESRREFERGKTARPGAVERRGDAGGVAWTVARAGGKTAGDL